MVERLWDLELERWQIPALILDSCELCFFHWKNRLLILFLGASENRSKAPWTRHIKEDGVYVSSLHFSRTDLLSSIDCCSVAWSFCSCYFPLNVLLLTSVALKVWSGQS